jgi:hypothetical protein
MGAMPLKTPTVIGFAMYSPKEKAASAAYEIKNHPKVVVGGVG